MEQPEQCGALQCVLLTKYYAGCQNKRDETGGHVGRMGKRKYRCMLWCWNVKWPFCTPSRGEDNNIKMGANDIDGKAWTGLISVRVETRIWMLWNQ